MNQHQTGNGHVIRHKRSREPKLPKLSIHSRGNENNKRQFHDVIQQTAVVVLQGNFYAINHEDNHGSYSVEPYQEKTAGLGKVPVKFNTVLIDHFFTVVIAFRQTYLKDIIEHFHLLSFFLANCMLYEEIQYKFTSKSPCGVICIKRKQNDNVQSHYKLIGDSTLLVLQDSSQQSIRT